MSDQKKDVEEKALKGSITLNEQRCKGCTYCITFCPTGAIKMGDKLNEKGYTMPALAEPLLCTGCDLCGTYCPEFAIRGYRLNKKGED